MGLSQKDYKRRDMKKKSLTAKNTKKTLPEKTAFVNNSKATFKKTRNKAQNSVSNKPKTALKRLGKGLKDISHLFLSGADKLTSRISKKTKKTTVQKNQKAPDVQSKQAAAPVARKELVIAGKKISVIKAKKTLAAANKKAVLLKTQEAPVVLNKKAAVLKIQERPVVVIKKTGKTAVNSLKEKTLVVVKDASAKTKKIIKKSSKKKIEVIRMPIVKKSGEKDESISKMSKKVSESKPIKKTKNGVKKKVQLEPISKLSSLFKTKKKSDTVFPGVSDQPEQIIEESKFFTGQDLVSTKVKERQLYELPAGYGDTRIIIQIRDPYWMHAYWEINEDKMNSVRRDLGRHMQDAKRILRVYDVTHVAFDGSNANKYFDIDINDNASSWYINGGESGRSFCVDIGYLLADGRFIMIARSNCIRMPIDGPSTVTDEEWMLVEDDFNRLYGMSVGLGIGLSSMELRKQISQRMINLSSGVLSSPGVQRKPSARKFWLKVETELIVYGATEPGAKVSVQGKPISLSKDGTFSLRFALPDGQQVIPVKGVSEDGLEERTITPVVSKKTE
ncbi:MAG: DUF4912 domain-containing protein [Candidatus Omnitrophica bacterium]|nr:DUF4912 domain-containing protein [Candidatus Omnitrophota bacterium]